MSTHPPVTMAGSHLRLLQADNSNREYQISVAMPYGFDEDLDRRWPVIFVLDANLYFGLVVDMVRYMNIKVPVCNELPDALVVGIGYPVEGTLRQGLHQVMHRRLADLDVDRDIDYEQLMQDWFPTDEPGVTGDAAAFLQFIADQVIPLAESDYRADPADRTLLGHSSAAVFTLYAMFQNPRLFRRYVAASVYPDPPGEPEYAANHTNLPVRLHLVGEGYDDDHIARHHALVNRLTKRRYTDFAFTSSLIPDITHCAMAPRALQEGLQAVFADAGP